MNTPPTSPATAIPPPARGAPEARKLDAGHGAAWWSESWSIFTAAPGTWIGIVVVLLVIMFCMVLVPVIGSVAQTLLFPVFAGGIMLGCQALARGEPLRLAHLFEGFQGGRFGPLVILGLLMMVAGFVLALIIVAIGVATIGISGLTLLMNGGDPFQMSMANLASLGFALFIILAVALIGGAIIAMAYWFAPALIVLNGEAPVAAIRKSFSSSLTNFVPFLIYGLIYIGLAIVATIPFGLGWLVLAPMIAGSCYAGWREIFGE